VKASSEKKGGRENGKAIFPPPLFFTACPTPKTHKYTKKSLPFLISLSTIKQT